MKRFISSLVSYEFVALISLCIGFILAPLSIDEIKPYPIAHPWLNAVAILTFWPIPFIIALATGREIIYAIAIMGSLSGVYYTSDSSYISTQLYMITSFCGLIAVFIVECIVRPPYKHLAVPKE